MPTHRPRLTVFLIATAAIALYAMPVFAQNNPSETPAAKQSFFDLVWHGAEVPGTVIGLLSLVSLTLIIQHFWTIRRDTMIPADEVETVRGMIERRQFKEILDYLKGRTSMFADVLTMSLRHGRHGFDAMHEAAEERSGAWSARLFRRVEYLNIIGNLGPLLGLLGTVLGMIEAFTEMKAAHGAYKPENLAGGIGLALVNTFLGLVVAIVSLAFFGICRNRVDAMTVAAHAAVLDVLEYFRPAPQQNPASVLSTPTVTPATGAPINRPMTPGPTLGGMPLTTPQR